MRVINQCLKRSSRVFRFVLAESLFDSSLCVGCADWVDRSQAIQPYRTNAVYAGGLTTMKTTQIQHRSQSDRPVEILPSQLARVLLLVALCGSLTGCCFEREWQAAKRFSYPERELAGCWEGTWQSDFNGHNGGLRAIITKQGDGYYDAHFHATYLAVIPFEFELPLLVTDDGRAYALEGEADLGWLAGGLYTYNGSATATDFVAAYSAENNDHGTFTMQKVQTCSECSGDGTCGAAGSCDGECCGASEGTCGACGK
jgi:hypothetical protein